VIKIFGLNPEKTWTEVRRAMTNEKIRRIFEVFASLWPLETELLQLLPKPDGRPRAVYTGLLHPQAIMQTAPAAGLYFGEVIVQHPFTHPRTIPPTNLDSGLGPCRSPARRSPPPGALRSLIG
jgi:hypothetical protein